MTEPFEEQSVIKLLDNLTIDQIAAGEVIEGPASCIKELIDNAVDAAASHICIEISVGGRERIRVVDNGVGMSPRDVLMSVQRHATSKITALEDLEKLQSRGFRGEALSSISSISKMTITSCKKQYDNAPDVGENGCQLIVHGGIQQSFTYPIIASYGTAIDVHNIFYNVPARRKFMKSPLKDSQEILKTISQLALAAPHIGFQFIQDGIQKLNLPAKTNVPCDESSIFEERIQLLYGEDVVKQGLFFYEEVLHSCIIRGFLGFPEAARTTRSMQHIIVNGRPIQSSSLAYAIKTGYATSIGRDQHPIFILQLNIASEEIDVNVHPQKKEIRFKDEEKLRNILIHVVAKHLFKLTQSIDAYSIRTDSTNFTSQKEEIHGDSSFLSKERGSYETQWVEQRPSHSIEAYSLNQKNDLRGDIFSEQIELISKSPSNDQAVATPSYFWYKVTYSSLYVCVLYKEKNRSHETSCIVHIPTAFKSQLIAQILQSNEGQTKHINKQPLLVPYLLRLSKDQFLGVEAIVSEIEMLGFSLRPFGTNTFLIEAVPEGTDIASLDLDAFFSLVTSQLKEKEIDETHILYSSIPRITPKMKKAIQRAHSLMSSLKPFTESTKQIPDKLVEYIIKKWIEIDAPLYCLSGEKIAMHIDDAFMLELFSSTSKKTCSFI